MALIPGGDSVTIGGRQLTNVGKLKVLYACLDNSGAGDVCTFRAGDPRTGAGYSPVGTFHVKAIAWDLTGVSGSVEVGFNIAQSDNDAGYVASGTLVNPVYFGSMNATNASFPFRSETEAVSNLGKSFEMAIDFLINSGKFLSAVRNAGIAGIRVYGYEL